MDKYAGLKWILLLVVLTGQFLFCSPVYAGWSSVSPPPVSSNWELLGLRFYWAVGQDLQNNTGVLLHFSNGSWTTVSLPSVSSDWGLSAIDFGSSHEGWAVGRDSANKVGALLHYSDGTWASVEPPGVSTDWGLSALDFISSNGGWIVGQDFEHQKGVLLFFSTVPVTPPVLSTTAVSGITTTEATSGGNISSDGGASVDSRGVCWDTSANPVFAAGGNCTSDGSGTGAFTSSITGLTPDTLYHVRAYATNAAGTGYGNDVTFTTLSVASLPQLTTTPVSSITTTQATSGGSITFDGGSPITARGVCWDTSINPGIGLTTCTNNGTGTGVFTSQITGLQPSTVYHVRAYATNSSGTGYGNDLIFTTVAASAAPLSTQSMSTQITPTLSTGTVATANISRPVLILAILPDVSPNWGLSGVRLAWVVGQDFENKKGVFLHLLGSSWISVEPPSVSSDWGLSGVDMISSQEGWAVGQDNQNKKGVLLHFINNSWTSVDPPPVSSDWGLSSVVLISSNEGWAAGRDNENMKGVLLHFLGGSWTPVDLPDISSDWGLSAVDMISSSQGWAVGQTSDGQNVSGVLLQFSIPQMSVSPASINYHDVEIGASSDQTVVVRNTGNGGLVIGAIGSLSSPFAIAADGCSGKTLAPLKTCQVTYRFLPDSEGTFSDSSTIPSNDSDVTLTLLGTGTAGTSNDIHLVSPPDGQTFDACTDSGSPLFQWDSAGVFSSIEVLFSSTRASKGISLKVKGSPDVNQLSLRSNTWKKVFLLPGVDGGNIDWMVTGTKRDKTTVKSDLFSLDMAGAEPVANPEISHTSKSTLPPPVLSWENRCNMKFKAWFGNGADFQRQGVKKTAISFAIQDPNGNGGIFTQELTSSQWSSIRKLGGDVTGAVLYWYVESSDVFGRKKKTDVTPFVLTD